MSINNLSNGSSGAEARTIINELVDAINALPTIDSSQINLGSSNDIRSTLGMSLGSYNYSGGRLATGTLVSGSTHITSSVSTSAFLPQDFLYITSLDTGITTINQIDTIDSSSIFTLSSSIDSGSTSIVFSQVNQGANTLNVGSQNYSSGNDSVNIGGGNETTRYGNSSLNVGTGNYCNNSNTLISGIGGSSMFSPSKVLSGNILNKKGDCQSTEIMIGVITTNDSPTSVLLYGDKKLSIPINTAHKFHIEAIAHQTGGSSGNVGDTYSQDIYGVIINTAGTTKLVGSPNTANTFYSTDASTWVIDVQANNTDDTLLIRVIGEANKTIKWVFKITFIQTKI
jgi:X-X-X-Leu-X-X-Gly heptad repeat protein